jgi:preprotein translocase subunit SecY
LEFNSENEEESRLYERLNKLAGILVAVFEAIAYVWGGMYGDIE